MRLALPEKLGSEFWFSLFMVVLCFAGAALGFARGWGYQASVGGLLGIFYFYRLLKHVEHVRLARHLKRNSEVSKIFYAPDQ